MLYTTCLLVNALCILCVQYVQSWASPGMCKEALPPPTPSWNKGGSASADKFLNISCFLKHLCSVEGPKGIFSQLTSWKWPDKKKKFIANFLHDLTKISQLFKNNPELIQYIFTVLSGNSCHSPPPPQKLLSYPLHMFEFLYSGLLADQLFFVYPPLFDKKLWSVPVKKFLPMPMCTMYI